VKSRPTLAAGIVAGLLALPVLTAAPASASHGSDDRVIKSGACSGSAHWKLKVKTDDGRLEVEGEVDSNRVGQTWRWAIRHNGALSARGTKVTTAPSGSFSVERRLVNLAGTDKVVFRARHLGSGQVCRGVIFFG
jgi:hypothetical protein